MFKTLRKLHRSKNSRKRDEQSVHKALKRNRSPRRSAKFADRLCNKVYSGNEQSKHTQLAVTCGRNDESYFQEIILKLIRGYKPNGRYLAPM